MNNEKEVMAARHRYILHRNGSCAGISNTGYYYCDGVCYFFVFLFVFALLCSYPPTQSPLVPDLPCVPTRSRLVTLYIRFRFHRGCVCMVCVFCVCAVCSVCVVCVLCVVCVCVVCVCVCVCVRV